MHPIEILKNIWSIERQEIEFIVKVIEEKGGKVQIWHSNALI